LGGGYWTGLYAVYVVIASDLSTANPMNPVINIGTGLITGGGQTSWACDGRALAERGI